jgi:YidC/Oxa1 family membrane protein insertase
MPDRPTKITFGAMWQQENSGPLTATSPVVLKYDNGEGLTFRRTISVDERYLFTIKDEVTNVGNAPVTLHPFALISRHGAPNVPDSYISFRGLIGYLGDQGLQEYSYKKIDDAKAVNFKVTSGWLGITDKYWASALLPATRPAFEPGFSYGDTAMTTDEEAEVKSLWRSLPSRAREALEYAHFARAQGDHDQHARFVLLAAFLQDVREAERPWLKPRSKRRASVPRESRPRRLIMLQRGFPAPWVFAKKG